MMRSSSTSSKPVIVRSNEPVSSSSKMISERIEIPLRFIPQGRLSARLYAFAKSHRQTQRTRPRLQSGQLPLPLPTFGGRRLSCSCPSATMMGLRSPKLSTLIWSFSKPLWAYLPGIPRKRHKASNRDISELNPLHLNHEPLPPGHPRTDGRTALHATSLSRLSP